jgi:tRNA 2-thiouridine synthesizing protein B
MSTLHIVNTSPYSQQALQRCLSLASSGDSVLLIEDGVYTVHSAGGNAVKLTPDLDWYALDTDLQARGITGILPDVTIVDYQGFVDLVCRCQKSVSWS